MMDIVANFDAEGDPYYRVFCWDCADYVGKNWRTKKTAISTSQRHAGKHGMDSPTFRHFHTSSRYCDKKIGEGNAYADLTAVPPVTEIFVPQPTPRTPKPIPLDRGRDITPRSISAGLPTLGRRR